LWWPGLCSRFEFGSCVIRSHHEEVRGVGAFNNEGNEPTFTQGLRGFVYLLSGSD